MKQIFAPMDTMGPLIRQQAYSPNTAYRWALFCLALPIEDGVILYHTLSGEMLWLTKAEYDRADADESLKTELVRKRFMVPVGFDEKRYADQVKKVVKLLQKESGAIASFTIFTTMDCNARCFYCYERGRQRLSMAESVARDVADYILRVSQEEKVSFRWFGGEPLLNSRVIDIITSTLRENGKPFTSSMVSNGYLFERETVQKAKVDWNLHKVQITLDGTEPVYNRTKAYARAEGSPYQKVLQSIDLLLKAEIEVSVRLNMHRNNADDLYQLAQDLAERFSGRKQLHVYVALLRNASGSFIDMEQQEALKAYRRLNAFLLERGLRVPGKLLRKPKTNYCMANHDGSVTVLPNGDLGKCEHFSESELFGSIYSEKRDEAVISAWKETIDQTDACYKCSYYPLCNLAKKCPYVMNACSEVDRQIRIDELKEQIYAAFQKSIEKEERGENLNANQE